QADQLGFVSSISGDGRYVAFTSHADTLVPGDINYFPEVFVRDLSSGITTLVSIARDGTQSNNASYGCSISNDGMSIAFASWATNLVPDDNNDNEDIF